MKGCRPIARAKMSISTKPITSAHDALMHSPPHRATFSIPNTTWWELVCWAAVGTFMSRRILPGACRSIPNRRRKPPCSTPSNRWRNPKDFRRHSGSHSLVASLSVFDGVERSAGESGGGEITWGADRCWCGRRAIPAKLSKATEKQLGHLDCRPGTRWEPVSLPA